MDPRRGRCLDFLAQIPFLHFWQPTGGGITILATNHYPSSGTAIGRVNMSYLSNFSKSLDAAEDPMRIALKDGRGIQHYLWYDYRRAEWGFADLHGRETSLANIASDAMLLRFALMDAVQLGDVRLACAAVEKHAKQANQIRVM